MFTLFSDFKVGTKIKTGYALVLCIAAFLVYQAYMGIDRLVDRADKVDDTNQISRLMLEAQDRAVKVLMPTGHGFHCGHFPAA